MKLLSGCGASTRGAGVGAALIEAAKVYKFDAFVGVSYSALIGVPLVMGMYDTIINTTLSVSHKDFFKVSPMNNKGGISFKGYMRLIGSIFAPNRINSIGVQDVKPLLERFITEQIFEVYKNSDLPIVYVVAVCEETQEPRYWNVKRLDYETYLKVVSASCRIPVWTQKEYINGYNYYDGGVTDTDGSSLFIDTKEVTEIISVYPRPKDFKGKQVPKAKGILGSIIWTIDTMLRNVSLNDALVEKYECEKQGVKLTQIFIPYVLKNLYDTDPNRLKELQSKSIEAAKEALKEHYT